MEVPGGRSLPDPQATLQTPQTQTPRHPCTYSTSFGLASSSDLPSATPKLPQRSSTIMPITLHEAQGLRIHRNDRNGFVVARLHFTADPRKRSPEWIAASRRGMSAAKWEQEFNISYTAQHGEKAFPEIFSKRHLIILEEGPYADGRWPRDLPMWAGFDFGTNNPSAFHVYTRVDEIIYAIWEMYEPCKNIIQFAQQMKSCPYWHQIKYIAHDPHLRDRRAFSSTTGELTSVLSQFEALGVSRWFPGNTDEAAWLSIMQKHWCGEEVTFKILQTCPYLIDEFEMATFKGLSDRQLETQNRAETLIDKHNHALDDCKYFMNSASGQRQGQRRVKIQSPLDAYAWEVNEGSRLPRSRQRELGIAYA